jgi:hypothetical protein
LDERKSTTGCVFFMVNGPISWSSKKQACVAMSSTEAEYIAMSTSVTELAWLRRLLAFVLKKSYDGSGESNVLPSTVIFVDNQSCLHISKSQVTSGHCKHIEVRFHNCRSALESGYVKFVKVASADNIADILTKPLTGEPFQYLRQSLTNFIF